MFTTSLITVAVMLLYAVPGFVLVKVGKTGEKNISAFAVFLMYVCQPCLTLYTFQNAEFSAVILKSFAYVFVMAFILIGAGLLAAWLLLKRKSGDDRVRVLIVAFAFGNCTFMGIPLLEALFPNNPETLMYSTAFFAAMSVFGWTAANAIIANDRKYMKPLALLLNPAVIGLLISIPLYCLQIHLPETLLSAVTLVGRMSTPLCMVVLGMRLATTSVRTLLCDPIQYLAAIAKQILFPLLALLLMKLIPSSLIPSDDLLRSTFYVLCCCPVASIVLNFAEMSGHGQKTAANTVLLSTFTSVLTMPLMLLLI